MSEVLRGSTGFRWDEGSSTKHEAKHVTGCESEEIFSNKSNRVELEFDLVSKSHQSISLRLPRDMPNQLKVLANKKYVP